MARSRKPTPSRASGKSRAPDGPRDFVQIAVEYATWATDRRNKAMVGKWLRLAARRFLADLKRAGKRNCPFTFDPWHANDACRFIELLPHVEGVWDTPTIRLHASHVFLLVNLFGFRKPDGTRRFTTALLAVARKNAKSTLASGIALYCLVAEGEVGPQVVAAATTGQQARIVFNVAKRMVEKTPDLREAFNLEPFANAVASYSNGGSLKPINAKASTQDGLNPSAVILDEVHAHKTHDLLNVLKSAAGARRNPLFLYTTTEGYESPGPWPEQRKFAQQVLEGVVEAEHFLALMFTVDEEDDDFDEVAWHKANPLMDVNPILLKEIRKEAIEAKQMPGRLAEFRIKRLNRPSSSAKGFIDLPRWKSCSGTVPLDQLEGLPCWGALDLASTSDLTVLRLVWRMPDGRWVTHGWRWVPEDAVASRTVRGTVPYAGWVAEGLIEQTSGNVTDYAVVEARIREVVERFRPAAVAYDPWNATELVNRLTEDELPMVQFIQGPKSYHPAMQELERAYRAAQLLHGGDPVLQWCASNLVVRYDANLNMAPDKRRAAEKIDDVVALAMAIGIAMAAAPEPQTITQGFVRI